LFQGLTAGVFGGLLTAWVAISAALAGAFTGAVAMCLVVPVLGWFIGLPIVFVTGMMIGTLWLCALCALFAAWTIVALYGLLAGLLAQLIASRR
jgi:hypothetical protein